MMNWEKIINRVLYIIYVRREVLLEEKEEKTPIDEIVKKVGVEFPVILSILKDLESSGIIKLERDSNGEIIGVKPVKDKVLNVLMWLILKNEKG